MKIVKIIWEDAAHAEAGWQDGLEPDDTVVIVESVGYLIKTTAKTLFLAQSLATDNMANLLQIPRVCVHEQHVLGVTGDLKIGKK